MKHGKYTPLAVKIAPDLDPAQIGCHRGAADDASN